MGTDITFDKLKALAAQGGVSQAGAAVSAAAPPTEDKILQYASKFNELLRTGNEIVTNLSNMKKNVGSEVSKQVLSSVASPTSAPAVYENGSSSVQSVSSEKVFNDIREMIKMVVQFKGDMTLTQASELLENNAVLIKGFLKERGYS